MSKEIVIIGAGIAGLTAAIAFEKLDYKVILFESTPKIKAVGAGLGIAGNAIGAFKILEIDQLIINSGKKLDHFPILDQKGNVLYSVSSDKIKKRFEVENFTIHRADLHNALLSQLRSSKIVTAKTLKSIQKQKDFYRLTFEDGSTYEAKNIIGADGINSKIRTFINPKSKIRFSGYDCWRGVIENNLNIKNGSETWGKNGRFGIVPLADNKVYWYLCKNRKSVKPDKLSKSELMNLFKDYHEPISKIIHATSEDSILFNPINDLQPHNIYAKKSILLIGDAAHATTPNLGQGACQAIEDIATLYQLLSKNDNLQESFKTFQSIRLKRTHFIVNTSWKIGKVAQIENPLGIAFRNFIFKNLPSFVNNKQLEKVIYNIDYHL